MEKAIIIGVDLGDLLINQEMAELKNGVVVILKS